MSERSGGSAAALRATVRGDVLGVGFADAVVARAGDLGLLGWVREDDDGAARVHAEGPADAVGELRSFLAAGPSGARVERIDEERAKVEGHEQFAVRGVPAGAFAVRAAGEAGRYELTLEVAGAVRVWSLAKAPSVVPAERRLAIEVDAAAHAGDAPVWDRGSYEQGGRVAWPEALERGHAVFVLHGERLRGGFALQRTRGEGPGSQWLLIKRRDAHAHSG